MDDKIEFAIFCIENVAEKMNTDGEKVYVALAEKSDILENYIMEDYDVLHTQGKEYIVDDIIETMKMKGVSI